MNDLLIKAEGLVKAYHGKAVVNNISLSIYSNEILVMIGPNGAGKSTTLEILLGLKKQDSGKVLYWDNAYKSQIGVQLQATPFFPGLTTYENLQLFAAFYKVKLTKQKGFKLLTLCGLSEVGGVEASKLSGGQQKRLAIALSLVHQPKIVFLDEPTAALDPRSRREIHDVIKSLHKAGKTVVFTSHDMDEVTKLASRVIMIDKGKVIATGSPVSLCEENNVKNLEELYLQLTMEVEAI